MAADELLAGGGWGFALPAELNGLPGPRHVLELTRLLNVFEIASTVEEVAS